MSLLEIKNLNVFYSSAQVLWDVSLTLEKGEIVSLIGVNGSGKTTLMKAISGLVVKKQGNILYQDTEILKLDASDIVSLGVAQVPEGRHLFTGMNVEDNLIMGAYMRKDKSEIKQDLEKMYEYFPKLKERRKQITGKMSGGEQQMCAIGRALMSRPELLLIDELSLGLAPVIIDELLEIVCRLRDEGMSILLVEQDVQTGLNTSSRAYVLEHGRVVISGDSQELQKDPKIKASYLGI